MPSHSLADLRQAFFNGESDDELAALQAAYDAGMTVDDLIQVVTDVEAGKFERSRTVSIMDPKFGVKAGAIDTYDAFMAAGSPVLISMGIGVGSEPGMFVAVENAGANGALWSTVLSVDNDNQLTLSNNSINAVNGGAAPIRALVAWDDTVGVNLAYATGLNVSWPEVQIMSESIIPPDKTHSAGAGINRTVHFKKPVVLSGNVGPGSHANIFRDDGTANRISDIGISEITFDGCGPRAVTGYWTAAAGGTQGLHQGTRGTADENLMEGVNFRACDRLRITNVLCRNCIGDGFDVDQNLYAVMVGAYADACRIGFHTSNGSRFGRYIGCTSVYCSTAIDQSTASGHDSLGNEYIGFVAMNSQVRNFNIMWTTTSSSPGNPDGVVPTPAEPTFGVTLAKYSITAGSDMLHSTVAAFTKADRKKNGTPFGAGVAAGKYDTRIIAYVDAQTVQLETAATTTVTEAMNVPFAYGWGVATSHMPGCRAYLLPVDLKDGRTGRSPTSADELRGVMPDGRFKAEPGAPATSGGLGFNGIDLEPRATSYSNNDTSSLGIPRIVYQSSFGNDPEKRRVLTGAYRDGLTGGFFIATHSSAAAGAETDKVYVDGYGNVQLAVPGFLAPTAVNGFTFLPSGHGPPTGVPAAVAAGQTAVYVDVDAKRPWLYPPGGPWFSIEPTPTVPLPANEQFIERSADRAPVNNSGTLVNDGVLQAPVEINSTYKVEAQITYDTSVAAKFKFGFFGPAGCRLNWNSGAISNSSTNTQAGIASRDFKHKTLADTAACGGGLDAGGLLLDATPSGSLVTGGTAGTFGIQIAQSVPTVYDTLVKQYSFIRLTKLI